LEEWLPPDDPSTETGVVGKFLGVVFPTPKIYQVRVMWSGEAITYFLFLILLIWMIIFMCPGSFNELIKPTKNRSLMFPSLLSLSAYCTKCGRGLCPKKRTLGL
jgi:hypothetical protein